MRHVSVCELLQASKVVKPHQRLLELQQEGLAIRDPNIPNPAVRGTQTYVLPFWTKPEDFSIYVRPFPLSSTQYHKPTLCLCFH